MKVLQEYLQMINEVAMSPGELAKRVGGVGEFRDAILLKKINAGQPIELEKGQPIIVDKERSRAAIQILMKSSNQLDDQVAKMDFFKANLKQMIFFPQIPPEQVEKLSPTDLKTYQNGYSLSALKKASYFGGGGGGKRSGAANTKLFESGTAMVMGMATRMNGAITSEQITLQTLTQAKGTYQTSVTPLQIMNFIESNPQWRDTFVNSTNALFGSFPQAKGMVFHHQSPWVKKLYSNYSAANKGIGGFFTGPDKWNPSDIWAVSPDAQEPPKTKSFDDLNRWTHEMFDKGKAFGISLKAAPHKATAKKLNYAGAPISILQKAVKDILTGKTNFLFNSAKSHITFESQTSFLGDYKNILEFISEADSGEIEFRAFQTAPVDIQGEITGKNAAHGKVGLPVINKYLKSNGLKEVTPKGELLRQWRENREGFINKIIELAVVVNPAVKATAQESLKAKVEKAKEYPAGFFVSKRQAIELAYNVSKGNKKQQNNFLMDILKYAGSESEFSSVYIKIA